MVGDPSPVLKRLRDIGSPTRKGGRMRGNLGLRFGLGITLMAVALGVKACSGGTPEDRIVQVSVDDVAVNEAKAEARARLDQFFARLEHPKAHESNFGLKFDLNHGHPERGQAEIIWASDISRGLNGEIYGLLDNEPATSGFVNGQRVEIPRESIADWAVMVGDKFEGHYTTRALMSQMSPAEAEAVKSRLW
jgi:uncharacterized protein YegJ (DUF2314 family)